ncbi:hypothetical protein JZ751_011378, partial [Albula glossodonta]
MEEKNQMQALRPSIFRRRSQKVPVSIVSQLRLAKYVPTPALSYRVKTLVGLPQPEENTLRMQTTARQLVTNLTTASQNTTTTTKSKEQILTQSSGAMIAVIVIGIIIILAILLFILKTYNSFAPSRSATENGFRLPRAEYSSQDQSNGEQYST